MEATSGHGIVEAQHATAEFGRLVAQSGSVERAWNDPHLFRSSRGVENSLCVAAGKCHISGVADQQHWKRSRRDSFFR